MAQRDTGAELQEARRLKALYLDFTLRRSPELSHTEGLMTFSMAIL